MTSPFQTRANDTPRPGCGDGEKEMSTPLRKERQMSPDSNDKGDVKESLEMTDRTDNNKFESTKSYNGIATTALVFGIISLAWPTMIIGPISAVVAITIGIVARRKIHNSSNTKGQNKAAWGIGLGIVSIVIFALLVILEINTRSAIYELLETKPELFQTDPSPTVTIELAETHNNQGLLYYKKGQIEEAIAEYTRAIEFNPKCAKAYSNRGLALHDIGHYDTAIEDCTKAIELDPSAALAFNNRGLAYDKKGKLDEAVADFTQAIQLAPYLALAYNNRGLIYCDKEQLNAAIADCTKAIELDPKLALAYNTRAQAYWKNRQYDQAMTDCNKAIELDPSFALAYVVRATVFCDKGMDDEAIRDCIQAIELNPNLAEAWQCRAAAYYLKAEYEKAWTDIKACRKLGGEVDPLLVQLIQSHLKRE